MTAAETRREPLPISVALIVRNEERNLPGALESVAWADDVIVVDSGSDDATREIARHHGARVHEHPWQGYAAQKNHAISLCRHDWVLSLDADERCTPELETEIRGLFAEGPPALPGFDVPRLNHFCGKWIRHGGWWPDRQLRLFDRRHGLFGIKAVHESVDLDREPGHLQHPLIHQTYDSVSDYLLRMRRYAALAADERARKGDRVRRRDLWFGPPIVFLRTYLWRGGFRDGRHGLALALLQTCYVLAQHLELWDRTRKLAATRKDAR